MTDPEDREELGPLQPRVGRLSLVFVLAVLVGLGSALFAGGDGTDPSGRAVDRTIAPEVVFDVFDGGVWRLSEHVEGDGRPVILNLWASWCPPCREEIPAISAFADDHPDVMVVGVAVEDRIEDARDLAGELKPRYLVGFDTSGTVRERYPSFGLPVTFLIDGEGRLAGRLEGIVDEERLRRALDGIS